MYVTLVQRALSRNWDWSREAGCRKPWMRNFYVVCSLMSRWTRGLTHTVVGSGEIVYDCDDKARRLYYGEKDWNWSNGGEQAGGLRGHQWAERYEQAGGAENMIKAAKEAMK